MKFKIEQQPSYSIIKLTVERLDSTISASLKNELMNV